MYCDLGTSSKFMCAAGTKVELPCDKPLNIKNIRKALAFIFDSLNKKEERWREMCTSWDIENVQITHLEHENGLLPTAYRVLVRFHAVDKPYSVLVKVRNPEVFRAEGVEENEVARNCNYLEKYVKLHEREVKFNNEIAPSASISVPAVYYTQLWDLNSNQEGIIVQEDLIREAVVQNVYNGLTTEQVGSVLSHLAEFHASLLCDVNIDETLSRFAPLESAVSSVDRNKLVDDLRQLYTQYFNSEDHALRKFILNEANGSVENKRKRVKRTVLAHGNLWTTNVKFKKSLLGRASTEVRGILNWQYCHEGSPIEDIACLIVTSTNSNVRKEHTNTFLHFYHEQLKENLRKRNKDMPYTLEEIHSMYNDEYPSQVFFLLHSHIPFILSPIFSGKATDSQKEMLANRMRDAFDEIRHNYL
ncbi:putative oxidoreductase dhs-27 [Toxocara canis]|uniref:Putative oxidoreductase dhs-27 n=1 Tax=Toxocara canis TaxID=6265 RepID=A0A0B2V8G8_TOXCA|nr:putative oxidoreductase dhs-27 [Toxocara canis]